MNTKQRTRILSKANSADLAHWEAEIKKLGEVKIVKQPHLGLVMMRAKESVEHRVFNVGEILISEATVSVDGALGFAALIGNEEEKTRRIAFIDAIFHLSSPKWSPIKEQLNEWLAQEEERQKLQKIKEYQLMKRSRVDFDVMDE